MKSPNMPDQAPVVPPKTMSEISADQKLPHPLPAGPYLIVINFDGLILECDDRFREEFGIEDPSVSRQNIGTLLIQLEAIWKESIPLSWEQPVKKLILPFYDGKRKLPYGLALTSLVHKESASLSLTSILAEHEDLKTAALNELPNTPQAIATTFLRLQSAESRLYNYMHNFPGIFFSQRPDYSFSYIGPKFEDYLGISRGPLYKSGNQFINLIHPQDVQTYLKEIEDNTPAEKTFSTTFRLNHPENGNILYIMEVRSPQLSATGLIIGYEGVWLDITRQTIAENRLSSTAWKESLATLTSGLVHDFSNIMSGIFSLSELYLDSMEDDHPWMHGMEQIKKNSMEAQNLVRRIIELNKELSGQRGFHNIVSLIKGQLELIRIILPKCIKLENLLPEEELPVYIDDVSFRQVLLNLAINARDALVDTGTISISLRHVPKDAHVLENTSGGEFATENEGVEIIFSDNGCGIDQDILPHIFDPFFTTKEAHKGSGFGLYNAKLFVESCKGEMGVSSKPGEGTSFHIFLPLTDFSEVWDEEEPGKDQHEASSSIYYKDKGRPSFLVYAAQDPSDFDTISIIQKQEWETICFSTEEDVLHFLEEADYFPHTVLIYNMADDPIANRIVERVTENYPFIKTCLSIVGSNPDKLIQEYQEKVDLVLHEGITPKEVLKKLTSLLK